MFKDENLNGFVEKMVTGIKDREQVYGDSWKKENITFLDQRLNTKLNEFKLTKNPEKLISLANLAMLLYVRMNSNGEKQ